MDIIYIKLNKNNKFIDKVALALGNFDGVHLGHKKLIEKTISCCNDHLIPSVLLFNRHTRGIDDLITTMDEKIRILANYGISKIYVIDFDEIKNYSYDDFLNKVLYDILGTRKIIVGKDYRFGKNASGNIQNILENKFFKDRTEIIEDIYYLNKKISSTRIRDVIKSGDMISTKNMLGRYFSISGVVVNGDKRGRTLGFPTANIFVPKNKILPKSGVYYTRIKVNGKIYNSMTDIGINPTFKNINSPVKIETHIFNFNENIYHKYVEINFIEYIREDKKFVSKEELISQLNKDVINIKNIINV